MSKENQNSIPREVAEHRKARNSKIRDYAIIGLTGLLTLGGAAETVGGVYFKDLDAVANGIIYTVGGGAVTELQRRNIKLNKEIQNMK